MTMLDPLMDPQGIEARIADLERQILDLERASVEYELLTEEVESGSFYIIVSREGVGAGIAQWAGGDWLPVSKPGIFPALAHDSFENYYSLVRSAGGRHFVGSWGGVTEYLYRSANLRSWTQEGDRWTALAGHDRKGARVWRIRRSFPPLADHVEYSSGGGGWTETYDFQDEAILFEPTHMDVHPNAASTLAVLGFDGTTIASSGIRLSTDSGASFTPIQHFDPFTLAAELGGDEAVVINLPTAREAHCIRFTETGRLLVLNVIQVNHFLPGPFGHYEDHLVLFYADAPYTSWSHVVIAGPYRSFAWGVGSSHAWTVEREAAIGIALHRDSSNLFIMSSHSDEPVDDDIEVEAVLPSEGHVYKSSNNGASWSELARPREIVRGIYYHEPVKSLFAHLQDGSVWRMQNPSAGKSWQKATTNLRQAAGGTLPYVNMSMWL
jgi:hypothetical protein